ncbi:hypothetical protein BH24CHL10_BH24CHL10_04040 [soil metagenome]
MESASDASYCATSRRAAGLRPARNIGNCWSESESTLAFTKISVMTERECRLKVSLGPIRVGYIGQTWHARDTAELSIDGRQEEIA